MFSIEIIYTNLFNKSSSMIKLSPSKNVNIFVWLDFLLNFKKIFIKFILKNTMKSLICVIDDLLISFATHEKGVTSYMKETAIVRRILVG